MPTNKRLARTATAVILISNICTAYLRAQNLVSTEKRSEKVSPFTWLEIDDDRVIVEFNKQSFQLLEIEDLTATALVEVATRTFGKELAEKRVAEDLVDVLVAAGKAPAKTVRLKLKDRAETSARLRMPR